MKKTSTYPLRLPVSKISALNTAAFFDKRRGKGDRQTFRRILNRKSGETPRPGDEL